MPDLDYHSFQLSFNSDNHDAGSNDEPVFYVRPEINNVVGMEYISGSATFTYYVTAAPYNTLQINRNGAGLVTLTVDEGNYNSSSMVTALGEALTNAYTILNKEKLVKEAQTNGEAIGRQNAYAQGAGSFGYISGGNSLKPQQRTVSLTKDQQVEYDRLKSENPRLANKYAEAVADSRE
jgi:hypothetical protein